MKYLFRVREDIVTNVVLDIEFGGDEAGHAGGPFCGANKSQFSGACGIRVHRKSTDNHVDMICCELLD